MSFLCDLRRLEKYCKTLKWRKMPKLKTFSFLLTITSIALLVFWFSVDITENGIKLALLDEKNVESSSIFFLETSGIGNRTKIGHLNTRQVCSLESAARMNPNTNIYVIFVDVDQVEWTKFIDVLRQFKNVHIVRLNSKSFGDGTPFEDFAKNQKYLSSIYPRVHASDFLRLLILWK